MLQSLKRLFGSRLAAMDGEIGPVKDLYFDDQHWAIRYLVADTTSWLADRQVLISPYSLELTEVGKLSVVNLTRKQVQSSPFPLQQGPFAGASKKDFARRG